MDLRNDIINHVMLSLTTDLSSDQLKKLNNSLYITLNSYDIKERSTELVLADTSSMSLLRKFIATKRIEGKAESTLKRYYDQAKNMIDFIQKPLDEITTYDLRFYLAEYKENRKVSNSTLDGMRRCIKSFFSWLFAEELIPHNPSASLSQIKCEKVVRKPYSAVDIELIKQTCQNVRDRAIVEFLYASGCRVSEVVKLNRNDINFSTKEALVRGKGSKQRIIYINDVALYYLQQYLNSRTDGNPCLFSQNKKPHDRLSKNGIEAMLRKLGQKANVQNVHPHRYRRTLATNMINRGASIQDVAIILGHEDIKTTQIYCYVNQGSVKSAYDKFGD